MDTSDMYINCVKFGHVIFFRYAADRHMDMLVTLLCISVRAEVSKI